MTFKRFIKNILFINVLFLLFTFIPNTNVRAGNIPDINTFKETVSNGNSEEIRGIYVSNLMAYTVVQQPIGNLGYVSSEKSVVTQFNIPKNIGLLAHNFYAGKIFPNVKVGDIIILIYGDGRSESFEVSDVQSYQALEPRNPYSNFKELESRDMYSADKLFNKVYQGEYHLTLQTCIQNGSELSWGRLFIIAYPVEHKSVNKNR